MTQTHRIAKYLSSCGIASRRKSEELVKFGLVSVNNQTITNPSTMIDPIKDSVTVKGRPVKQERLVYYVLNKPVGYTTTAKDKFAEKIISELIPREPKVWPVGRLDKNTEGLIIMTNDGELTQKVSHPSFGKEKEYLVKTNKPLQEDDMISITDGVLLEDGEIKADKLVESGKNQYKITIHLGKKRIVRRIFAHFGVKVVALCRTRIGKIELGTLKAGEYRKLTSKEVEELNNA